MSMGLQSRMAALLQSLVQQGRPELQESVFQACKRLVDPEQMGTLFKVLCLAHRGSGTPVAFEGAEQTKPQQSQATNTPAPNPSASTTTSSSPASTTAPAASAKAKAPSPSAPAAAARASPSSSSSSRLLDVAPPDAGRRGLKFCALHGYNETHRTDQCPDKKQK